MDANKLLEILLLLEADEGDFKFETRIGEILNFLGQNNEEGNRKVEEHLREIEKDIALSRAAQFAGTEIELLKNLRGDSFFGVALIGQLQKILNESRGYEISSELNKFKGARTEKMNGLMRLKGAMSEAGIIPYKQTRKEIALTLPEGQADIASVSKRLSEFGRFVSAIQACQGGGEIEQPNISRLSKGTLEFFTAVDVNTAEAILHCLSDLAVLYATAVNMRKKAADPMLTESENKEVAKIYNVASDRRVEEYVEKMVEKIAGTSEAEKKATLRSHFKLLLKWLPLGIHLEVILDKSTEPITKDPQGKYNPEYMALSQVQHKAQIAISEMYALPLEQLKLSEPEDEAEEPKP